MHRNLYQGVLLGLFLALITACTPSGAATPVPTRVLIPATDTPTATPVTPTSTPGNLPAPQDLVATLTPQALGDVAISDESSLNEQIQADLAAYLGVDVGLVRVIQVEEAVWFNNDLGCAEAEVPVLEGTVEGLRLTLLAGKRVYGYHTIGTSTFRRCPGSEILSGSLLVQVDTIAAELVDLARRQVAQDLDLSSRRVELVEAVPVTWPDTSLGCPLEGQTYRSSTIDGYRIVVRAAEQDYIFHTDSVQLIPCDPANEQLPAS